METTFVALGNGGFWIQDSILGLWLRLLALHLEDPSGTDSPAQALRDEWLLASRGYFSGCAPFDLELDVSTKEGRTLVLAAIESLMGTLRSAPARIDAPTLNLLGIEARFPEDVETAQLLKLGDSFRELIQKQPVPILNKAALAPRGQPIAPCVKSGDF